MSVTCKWVNVFVLLAGCATERGNEAGESREPVAAKSTTTQAPSAPVPPVRKDELLSPRDSLESSGVDVSAYAAEEVTFRLFGVESEDDVPIALIAETSRWETRPFRVGDSVGRGLRIARIGEHRVVVAGADGDYVLEPGRDVRLRVISHKLDVVAQPLGRHRFVLNAEAARAAKQTLPEAQLVELYDAPMWKLGALEAGSVLREAGFEEGELVAEVDGVRANGATLTQLRSALVDGSRDVSVRVVRRGSMFDRIYQSSAR